MPLLPRRFEKLKAVLNCRMADLTVLLENVEKPHNLSAILRSCDAVGVLEAHVVCQKERMPTFNSTAQGSQKWVQLHNYNNFEAAAKALKEKGFKLFGTNLGGNSIDFRDINYTKPTAFVLGAEKWGLSEKAANLVDNSVFIPMRGMVQSLNVSVAGAILLFEALRQRDLAGITPKNGEGLKKTQYDQLIFEWAYPEVAKWCQEEGRKYPQIDSKGEIIDELPRTVKLHY